ncbi:uncharacterized protein LOC112523903 [Cynara cardunculus var. scolymus]|uniref:Uncharacterized protein n=1 Tax=Cynara cardunculus var. scolymus TaxID=59895 RepID=A0A103XTG1_CYNCS|nr:uncharacterized protein LOC112523903 [Cynara cardunculus var. scolymus]KVH96605.1 hypothetical protein Ccrd_001310 [Cynara cardunculus var. scolymus]
MSVLNEYPEAISNKKDVQIWNNAAFDNGDGLNSSNLIKPSSSWSPLKKSNQPSDSVDSSFSSKENQSPSGFSKSAVSVSARSTVLVHQSKPLKNLPIKIVVENLEEKTDEEIEIENEISRLYARLESLRLKRADQNAKNLEKQGRTVDAAKIIKNRDSGVKKIEESGFSRTKIQRRGFSLGPNEIMSATNPKSKQLGATPIQSTQNRRKSCFWKLEDIEEEKMGVSRGKNLSLRQAVTTGGAKKGMKKDDSVLSSIQPKKLFGEQSVPAKKPLKPGRVIASRYNQATVTSLMRKKSLTDNNVDRKSRGTEGRVKRRWEIPSEIVIPKRLDLDSNENENESEGSIDVVMPDVLPRIRAVRYVDETGRDSGPAKRVAELVGKKSYFDEEEAVCQRLSFEEEEEEEE